MSCPISLNPFWHDLLMCKHNIVRGIQRVWGFNGKHIFLQLFSKASLITSYFHWTNVLRCRCIHVKLHLRTLLALGILPFHEYTQALYMFSTLLLQCQSVFFKEEGIRVTAQGIQAGNAYSHSKRNLFFFLNHLSFTFFYVCSWADSSCHQLVVFKYFMPWRSSPHLVTSFASFFVCT